MVKTLGIELNWTCALWSINKSINIPITNCDSSTSTLSEMCIEDSVDQLLSIEAEVDYQVSN